MFWIVFFQLSFVVCYGQFPRACTDDLSLSTGRCCPLWPAADGTGLPCGEAVGRGTCRQIQPDDSPHSPSYPYVGADDRERWPTVYWNWTCECRDNFYGVDCSECKYGFVGPNCTERKVLIRRNIYDLSWWERTRFLRALDESKTTVSERWVIPVTPYVDVLTNGTKPAFANVTTYDALVWMHYYVVRDVLLPGGGVFKNVDFAHEGPGFLPWHRLYLLLLERELAKIVGDENFALPYWDWRDLADCGDMCTDDFLGASQQNGTGRLSGGSFLSNWQVICSRSDEYNNLRTVCDGTPEGPLQRNAGKSDRVSALPTWEEVQAALDLDEYEAPPYDRSANFSFRNSLEGFASPEGISSDARYLHAAVHVWLNGTVTASAASANDPVFFLHHAFVDSIYELWLRKFRPNVSALPAEGARIGHNRGSYMVPFLPLHTTADLFTPAADFGYDYDFMVETEGRAWWEDLGFLEFYGVFLGGVLIGILLLAVVYSASKRLCCRTAQAYRESRSTGAQTIDPASETFLEATPLLRRTVPERRWTEVVYI
ncbi:PREDICTED: tyrosinase-like [Branchiostoma belcheri]|uniref:Tyrosinase n=1 Tax=Branchiostoma belcheri TaxID=7741 RepID=A0A6P4YGM5_BRABE|nr:PREDICTED: tyrosinase-like [Branchiostoma belcheri]